MKRITLKQNAYINLYRNSKNSFTIKGVDANDQISFLPEATLQVEIGQEIRVTLPPILIDTEEELETHSTTELIQEVKKLRQQLKDK